MKNKRTHIIIPEQLTYEIDSVVGKRMRSKFLVEAAWTKIKQIKMLEVLEKTAGSWKDKDHPELKKGGVSWIKKIRREEEIRLKHLTPKKA